MKTNKIIAAVFAALAFCFWAFWHPEWLNFHEQYQMFLFSWDYLVEHLALPGGMGVYISEFLVQFFYNTYLGAAVVAAVLTAIFLLSVKISQKITSEYNVVPLHLLTPVLLWVYLGDINALFAFPVSILLAQVCALGFFSIDYERKIWLQILLLPIIYWFANYCVWIYALLTSIYLIKNNANRFNTTGIAAMQMLGLVFFIFWVAYFPVRNYPFSDLFGGIDYYRGHMEIPFWQHLVAISCVVVPFVAWAKARRVVDYCLLSVVAAAGIAGVFVKYDNESYSYYKIDYYARTQQWDRLLDYAHRNHLTSDMAATGVNLALAMTNQLTDRLFEFYQPGNEGFLSTFGYNLLSCGPTAEACHYLGMNNSVLRYNFDLQSAILNCKYGGRFFRRIAESYLLNRRYDVAQRYLKKLKQTLFYRSWALEAESCLYDEEKIKANPEWARMLKLRFEDGLNFSHAHLDQMLVFLFEKCPENRMALDYALCSCLVRRDLMTFVKHFPYFTKYFGIANIPEIYQQAFLTACVQYNYSVPSFISQKVIADFREFDSAYLMNPNDKAFKDGKFSKTFWKYYLIDPMR